MKKIYTLLTFALALSFGNSNAQNFMEEFDDISAGIPAGWDTVQRSSNRDSASTDWFQGNPAAIPLYSGAGYIGANWGNTSTTGTGTISNWLISPVCMLNNGDVIIFNTSSPAASTYPDRMQVRVSQAGPSDSVGIDETTTGDFTMLVTDINPTYLTTPTAGSYPDVWTRYALTLSGLPAAPGVSGRFAFRYFVENAGWTGANSNYIGIDSVEYVSFGTGVEEINISSSISIYPNPANNKVTLNFDSGKPVERTITVTDLVGRIVLEQVINKNNISINVAELNSGSYMLTTKGEDGIGTKKLVIVK